MPTIARPCGASARFNRAIARCLRLPALWVTTVALAFAALSVPQTALAQQGEDFSFKRVRAPSQGGTRGFVQIDPAEQARLLATPEPRQRQEGLAEPEAQAGAVAPRVGGAFDWYWEGVSPVLGQTDGRFARALEMLTRGPGGAQVSAPRLQHMQEIAQRFGTEILRATVGTRVSPALVLAVIGIESAGRAEAVSHAGAVGLMQLIPATAERFGVGDSTDPAQNIRGGVAYLDWLMKEFDADPVMVLAAYNAGEGAVRRNAGVPPYAETRAYVPKVLAAWQVAQGLCLTPPELVSDPCVFNVVAAGG